MEVDSTQIRVAPSVIEKSAEWSAPSAKATCHILDATLERESTVQAGCSNPASPVGALDPRLIPMNRFFSGATQLISGSTPKQSETEFEEEESLQPQSSSIFTNAVAVMTSSLQDFGYESTPVNREEKNHKHEDLHWRVTRILSDGKTHGRTRALRLLHRKRRLATTDTGGYQKQMSSKQHYTLTLEFKAL